MHKDQGDEEYARVARRLTPRSDQVEAQLQAKDRVLAGGGPDIRQKGEGGAEIIYQGGQVTILIWFHLYNKFKQNWPLLKIIDYKFFVIVCADYIHLIHPMSIRSLFIIFSIYL